MCIYTFITLVSGFVYFGRAGSLGVSSGGPGHILFLRGVPLCGVSVRYNLFERLLGVGGGAVQVFFWYYFLSCVL